MLDFFGPLEAVLVSFGYFALFGMVFAESGLFFGFFLPGDSLLFTAGLLASKGIFQIEWVLIGTAICAILGDQVGYWTGSKFGKRFFNKPKSLFRDPQHIKKAEEFYAKHGKKTIVLARFVPAVRTFAPIVAGTAHMDYKTFITYNILGGLLWTLVFVLAGYFLGSLLPNSGEILTGIVLLIILVSLVPLGIEYFRKQKKAK
jgi:membrane-associated protein